MGFLLYTVHVVTSIFLILVVLLQQGKGADLSVFGGGATMTAFGARGAASLLHKFTVGGFVVFILTTLAIGVYQTRSADNVLGGLPSAEEAATTPAAGESTDGTEDRDGADDAAEEEPGDVTGVFPEAEEPALSSPEAGAEGEGGTEGEGAAEGSGTEAEDSGAGGESGESNN